MTISVKYNPNNGLYQTLGGDGVDFGASPVSSTNFNGILKGIFSGSHTALADGTSAFIAGANMTITKGSNGSLTFHSSGGASATTPALGRVLVVDDINGNDSIATMNGPSFKTIAAAIAYINTNSLTYVTVWIMPGTYVLTSGITVPTTCAIRGINMQTCILSYSPNVSATMLTMGEQTRVEDLTLNMFSTSSTANLTAVELPGNTSVTSKLRTCIVTVNNSSVDASSTTNVYGIHSAATGDLGIATFSFNFSRIVTINIISNGAGIKAGICLDGTSVNSISTMDTNIYIADPMSSASTGTYVGVYSTNRKGQIQLRVTSVSAPTHTSLLTNSAVTVAAMTNVTTTGAQTIQGISLVAGDRVLLTGQTSAIDNGIWIVQAGSWTRATDMPAGSNASGTFVYVNDGDYFAQKFLCTSLTAIVGTNSLSWIITSSGLDLKPPVFARYTGGAPTGSLAAQGTYTPTTGDRIFLDQAVNPVNNGIWVYNSAGAWTRSLEMSAGTSALNAHVFVYNGNNANTTWHSMVSGTVGNDALSFSQTYTGADVLQLAPTIANVDYGINVGPGTDLVHRSGGGRPMIISGAKRVITYSLRGNIQNGTRYMWPGLQSSLDTIQSFYRFGYDTCVRGIDVVCRNSPGTAVITITVLWSMSGRPGYGIATPMRMSFTDGTLSTSYSACSVDFKAGSHIAIQVNSTGNVTSADMTVEITAF